MIKSLSRIKVLAFCNATMEGIFKLLDKIAVWEVTPPPSVTKAAYLWFLKCSASAGEMSCATKIVNFSLFFAAIWFEWPKSILITLSTTCITSCFLSLKY